MLQFVEITKKYGVTGVLACWLWITNSRVQALESRLEHCYQMQMLRNNRNASIIHDKSIKFAILADKFKIKRA